MDRKQALYWLIFSIIGFIVLILTGEHPVAKETKESFDFGVIELGALGLLLGTWVFLTGSKPERKKLKIDFNNLKVFLANGKLDEAIALWPSIESQVNQVLAQRDPLYQTYHSLRFEVTSIDRGSFEKCKQSFLWLKRHFKKTRNWKQLIHYSLLYVVILESQKSEDEACDLLEELHELSEKYNFPSNSIETKLERLQNQFHDS